MLKLIPVEIGERKKHGGKSTIQQLNELIEKLQRKVLWLHRKKIKLLAEKRGEIENRRKRIVHFKKKKIQ